MPQSNIIAGAGGMMARMALDSLAQATETKKQREQRWMAEREAKALTKARGGAKAEKFQKLFRNRVKAKFKTSRHAFNHFDRKTRGMLSHTDFKHAIEFLNMKVTGSERRELRKYICRDGTSGDEENISFGQFCAFMKEDNKDVRLAAVPPKVPVVHAVRVRVEDHHEEEKEQEDTLPTAVQVGRARTATEFVCWKAGVSSDKARDVLSATGGNPKVAVVALTGSSLGSTKNGHCQDCNKPLNGAPVDARAMELAGAAASKLCEECTALLGGELLANGMRGRAATQFVQFQTGVSRDEAKQVLARGSVAHNPKAAVQRVTSSASGRRATAMLCSHPGCAIVHRYPDGFCHMHRNCI